jgi:hypothetical protein
MPHNFIYSYWSPNQSCFTMEIHLEEQENNIDSYMTLKWIILGSFNYSQLKWKWEKHTSTIVWVGRFNPVSSLRAIWTERYKMRSSNSTQKAFLPYSKSLISQGYAKKGVNWIYCYTNSEITQGSILDNLHEKQ